jgi:fructose transport system permease protein
MAAANTTSDSFESAAAGSPQAVATFKEERQTFLQKCQHWLHQTPSAVPMIVLLLSIVIFGLAAGNFFRTGTLSLILQQIAVVGILGCAQSIVILTAGIDLSVGAMAVFTSVIMGMFTFRYGIPAPISIVCGLVAGTAMGAANGYLVARMKLPPFIVTLGTWQIIIAANYLYSANETIRSQDIEAAAPLLQLWGWRFSVFGTIVSLGVVLLVFMVLVMAYVLKHTAWGRHVYAIGDDPEAAKLSGVQVNKMLIQVYALGGFFCAIAGWVMIGRFGSVSPSASTGVLGNIQSITAVVIGGISLFGGRGSIMGMFFGALIVGVFELGLRMLGTDPQWTYLLIGALIIGAVAIDQWIRKA